MKNKFFLLYVASCVSVIFFSFMGAAEEPAVKKTSRRALLFTIQIESVANKDQAQALENKFIQKGYPAYVEMSQDNAGKIMYQVRIGQYGSRSEAETAARTFYKKEKKPYWITPLHSDGNASDAGAAAQADRAKASGMEEEETDPAAEEVAETNAPDPDSTDGGGKQDANVWPATITKIYSYRGPQGSLCITNNLERIPRELQDSVESISIFPVKFIAFNQKKKVLTLEVEKGEQDVSLMGVALSSAPAVEQVAAYCEKNLKDVPLRLKYTPLRNEKKSVPFPGTILLKQGTLVNLEIVRLGLAPCAAGAVPAQFKKDCMEAEAAARSSKAGIWAENARQ
jgi:hypothetical protein